MTEQEIRIKVMEKYPVTAEERRGCATEKFFRGKMREEYKQKLLKQNSDQRSKTSVR